MRLIAYQSSNIDLFADHEGNEAMTESEALRGIKNTLILPPKLYSLLFKNRVKVVSEKYAPMNKAYFVDENGRTHIFEYLGEVTGIGDEPYTVILRKGISK